MIVASLFGVPAGLEVHHIPIGEDVRLKIDDAWVDISLDEAALTGDQTIYRTFRRSVSGRVLTFVGVYRPAKEIGPNREGGFYGAGLWVIDASITSQLVLDVIVHLADQIRDLAMMNGKFLKKIADVRSAIVPPPQVAKLVSSRSPLKGGISIKNGESQKAFITDTHNINSIMDWAQCGSSAKIFETVIVAPVEQFVPKKSTYSIGFDRYDSLQAVIQSAYELIEQKLVTSLSELKNKDTEIKQKSVELKSALDALHDKDNELRMKDGDIKRKDAYIASLNNDLHGIRARESSLQSELSTLKSKLLSHSTTAGKNSFSNTSSTSGGTRGMGYLPGSSSPSKTSFAEFADNFDHKVSHFFPVKLVVSVVLALMVVGLIGSAYFFRTKISEYVLSERLSNLKANAEKLEGENKKQQSDIEELKKQVSEAKKSSSTDKSVSVTDKAAEQSSAQLTKYDVTFKPDRNSTLKSMKVSDKKTEWVNSEINFIIDQIINKCSSNEVENEQPWIAETKAQLEKNLNWDSPTTKTKIDLPSDCKNDKMEIAKGKEYVLTLIKQRK